MGRRDRGLHGEDNWFDQTTDSTEHELELDVPEERLPWLESDDDGEEPAAIDTGRLIGFGLILLVALVVLVGSVWFLTNRGLEQEPEPDGSLIAAPEMPYKVRPPEPGGKTFAGTGDTSYAVGAGKQVEGRLAVAPPAAAIATVEPKAVATSRIATPATASAEAALPAGTAVQIGAYSSRADAEAGWRRLRSQTELLSTVSHRVLAGRADIGTVYRLQVAGGDRAGAEALCARLKNAGIACQVK